jgi:hypothetical protein
VEIVDLLPRGRPERHHATVAYRSGLLIKWFADPKSELASPAVLVDSPPGRNAIPLGIAADAALHAERRQRCVVERNGFAQVVRAEVDVSEHTAPYL